MSARTLRFAIFAFVLGFVLSGVGLMQIRFLWIATKHGGLW